MHGSCPARARAELQECRGNAEAKPRSGTESNVSSLRRTHMPVSRARLAERNHRPRADLFRSPIQKSTPLASPTGTGT